MNYFIIFVLACYIITITLYLSFLKIDRIDYRYSNSLDDPRLLYVRAEVKTVHGKNIFFKLNMYGEVKWYSYPFGYKLEENTALNSILELKANKDFPKYNWFNRYMNVSWCEADFKKDLLKNIIL